MNLRYFALHWRFLVQVDEEFYREVAEAAKKIGLSQEKVERVRELL